MTVDFFFSHDQWCPGQFTQTSIDSLSNPVKGKSFTLGIENFTNKKLVPCVLTTRFKPQSIMWEANPPTKWTNPWAMKIHSADNIWLSCSLTIKVLRKLENKLVCQKRVNRQPSLGLGKPKTKTELTRTYILSSKD